jgi:uncharacterized protein YecE (DUF72 family)
MMKRPKAAHPTLFDMAQLGAAPTPAAAVLRPYENDDNLYLGTSSFTADGWQGCFYPKGMKPAEYLSHYARTFRCVEIDSSFYGTPAAGTVNSWYAKTPSDFIFAAKVPKVVTHDKVLQDCNAEFSEFVDHMSALQEKRGPFLFQFPWFDKYQFKDSAAFLDRLRLFLRNLPDTTCKFAVEIRNKGWIDERFLDGLRECHVALALTDTNWISRPWEMKDSLDLITSDFVYVRWLGNRKEIEAATTTWDHVVVDRTEDLRTWVKFVRDRALARRLRHVFLFANNHYQGFGPATVQQFWELWRESKP